MYDPDREDAKSPSSLEVACWEGVRMGKDGNDCVCFCLCFCFELEVESELRLGTGAGENDVMGGPGGLGGRDGCAVAVVGDAFW